MKTGRFPPHFTVRVGIQGVGVFTKKAFKKGSVLFRMKGEIVSIPTRTSVQIGKHKHIEDMLAGHVNHNCHPNTKVNRKIRSFVALKDIAKGEEITFNYNQNEDKMATPFRCECCGRKIAGKLKLKEQELLTA